MTGPARSRSVVVLPRLGVALALVGLLSSVGGVFAASSDTASTGAHSVETAAQPAGSTASVGDRVWSDLDHDGVADLGEPGVGGVTVTLLDGLDTPLATDVSDGAGTYGFGGLAPGTYRLAFSDLPAGSLLTYQGAVPGDGTDSDPDPVTGRTGDVVLAAGQAETTVDAGVWAPAPSLTLMKRAQGMDADSPPGPVVAVGSLVTFDYLVTNTGNEPLAGLSVTDDRGVVVSCPQGTVGRGDTVACTGSDTAVEGPYTNVGTAAADGEDSGRPAPTVSDPAHYTGVTALLDLEKQVNGHDADSAADPVDLDVGDTATFTFRVANTGTETVGSVVLADGATTITCPKDQLDPGEAMECAPLDVAAEAGLHTNVASVSGTGQDTATAAGATDSASYFGREPAATFLKEVLDPVSGGYLDGDADPGTPGSNSGVPATIAAGSTARFRFTLVNTGNTALSPVTVTDAHCDAAPSLVSGDGGTAGTLDVGESWSLACAHANVTAGFTNTASVAAGGISLTERARVVVAAGVPGIRIDKTVQDPTTGGFGDRATLASGATATFRLLVTNRGERTLSDVVVTDPAAPDCGRHVVGPLAPGASLPAWTCTVGPVTAPLVNQAAVSAQPAGGGDRVSDDDTATVDVIAPGAPDLRLTKTLDGRSGRTVTWHLTVDNAGPGAVGGPLVVTDHLPAGLRFVSGSGGGFTCVTNRGDVVCTRPAGLDDGESVTIVLTTRAEAGASGTLTNTAEVRGDGADADAANNADDARVTLEPGGGRPGGGPGAGPGGPGDDAPGPLARTGGETWPLVLSGLCLTAMGVVLVVHARRRRRQAEAGSTTVT